MHHMTDSAHGWLTQITTDTTRNIAANIGGGVSHTTVSRAANAEHPPAHLVVEVARAYGTHPVRALELAGYLTAEEAHPYTAAASLRQVPTLVLLQELARREAERER